MNLKTESDRLWRWWVLLVAALLLVSVGCYIGRLFEARRLKADIPAVPQQEIVAVDNVTEKLKNVIEKAQSERMKLPEVVKNVKENVVRDMAGIDNNGIAEHWNGLLGRYREDRASTKRILPDE